MSDPMIYLPPSTQWDMDRYAVMEAANANLGQEVISQVIHPDVQDRWQSLTTHSLTPDYVKQILRGALTGNLVYQHELFDLMEDTWPRLSKNLNRIKNAVKKSQILSVAYAEDGQAPSKLAQEKADFLEQVIYNFAPNPTLEENHFEDAIYDVMDAYGKGISVNEILWHRYQGHGHLSGCVIPRATNWVHPRHYGWDGQNPQMRLNLDGTQSEWINFPVNQFIISKFKTKTGHSSSTALLRKLACFWVGANFGYDWLLNFAQLFGIPIRWATYDKGASQANINSICEMLANMGSAGWGAFPAGTTMELKEAVQRAADNPQSYLMSLADTACDILILGQTLTTDVGASGSRALGDVHQGVEGEIIDHCAGWAMDTLSYQLVAPLMVLNFGNNDEDPCLEAQSVRPKDAKGMVERDKILFFEMGLPVTKEFLYERHGVPQPSEGDDIYEKPQAESFRNQESSLGGAPAVLEKNVAKSDAVKAKAVAAKSLAENVSEELTGVSHKWLRPVAGVFQDLITKAQDGGVSDEDLLDAVEAAAVEMPELFPDLQRSAGDLRELMIAGMGAATVNGAQQSAPVRQKSRLGVTKVRGSEQPRQPAGSAQGGEFAPNGGGGGAGANGSGADAISSYVPDDFDPEDPGSYPDNFSQEAANAIQGDMDAVENFDPADESTWPLPVADTRTFGGTEFTVNQAEQLREKLDEFDNDDPDSWGLSPERGQALKDKQTDVDNVDPDDTSTWDGSSAEIKQLYKDSGMVEVQNGIDAVDNTINRANFTSDREYIDARIARMNTPEIEALDARADSIAEKHGSAVKKILDDYKQDLKVARVTQKKALVDELKKLKSTAKENISQTKTRIKEAQSKAKAEVDRLTELRDSQEAAQ